jgi:hypothetical protein
MKKLILKSGLFRKSNINSEVGGELNITSWIKRLLSYLNITYADPCCPTDFSPARYNNDTNELENYNQTTNSWESSTIPYLPLVGGEMIDDASISWENGQYISKGSTDTGLGGDGGISLFCSVGYELNWQAGVLTNFQGANNIQNIKLGSHLQFDINGTLKDSTGAYSIAVDERYLHDSDENTVVSWGVPDSYSITLKGGQSTTDIGDYSSASDYSRLEQSIYGLRFTSSSGPDGSNQGLAQFVCSPSESIWFIRDVDNVNFNSCELSPTEFKIRNQLGYWLISYNVNSHQSIIIGDSGSNQNGTYLEIDDANAKIKFSQNVNIATGIAPASSTAPGTEGDVIFTDDAIYRCIATDTWKRTPLTTW